jgi:ADP-ribosyl-[dinitrogen reductase] hydrolase
MLLLMAEMLEGFRGCLLGLAVGDALGMPTEGYSREEIRSKFGVVRDMIAAPEGHFHSGLLAGQYTDDTEQALVLADSLIESAGFSAMRFAEKLAEWGASWTLDEKLNRGVGFTSRSAVENLIAGVSWKDSGLGLPTCGSAMRVAPLGLLYHCDLSIVSRYADLQSLPTHSGAAARAGSIAMAVGVALSLKGFCKEMVLRMAAALAGRADREFAERLLWTLSLIDLPAEDALGLIRSSPLVSEAVPAAFYCYVKFRPQEALIAAANGGGDTDSIASMAGALCGAHAGATWIPERWLSCLEDRERLERAAGDLAELSSRLCP